MSIINQLAVNQAKRIGQSTDIPNDSILCQVQGRDGNTGLFKGIAADGSIRLFRYLGNAALAIGDQVSVTTPYGASVGYADSKAR